MDGGIADRIAGDLLWPGVDSPLAALRRFRLWWLPDAALPVGGLLWCYGVSRPVDAVVVTPAPFATTVSGPGRLDASVKVEASARVQGRIVDLRVEQNDLLRPGAWIVRPDVPDTVQQLAPGSRERGGRKPCCG